MLNSIRFLDTPPPQSPINRPALAVNTYTRKLAPTPDPRGGVYSKRAVPSTDLVVPTVLSAESLRKFAVQSTDSAYQQSCGLAVDFHIDSFETVYSEVSNTLSKGYSTACSRFSSYSGEEQGFESADGQYVHPDDSPPAYICERTRKKRESCELRAGEGSLEGLQEGAEEREPDSFLLDEADADIEGDGAVVSEDAWTTAQEVEKKRLADIARLQDRQNLKDCLGSLRPRVDSPPRYRSERERAERGECKTRTVAFDHDDPTEPRSNFGEYDAQSQLFVSEYQDLPSTAIDFERDRQRFGEEFRDFGRRLGHQRKKSSSLVQSDSRSISEEFQQAESKRVVSHPLDGLDAVSEETAGSESWDDEKFEDAVEFPDSAASSSSLSSYKRYPTVSSESDSPGNSFVFSSPLELLPRSVSREEITRTRIIFDGKDFVPIPVPQEHNHLDFDIGSHDGHLENNASPDPEFAVANPLARTFPPSSFPHIPPEGESVHPSPDPEAEASAYSDCELPDRSSPLPEFPDRPGSLDRKPSSERKLSTGSRSSEQEPRNPFVLKSTEQDSKREEERAQERVALTSWLVKKGKLGSGSSRQSVSSRQRGVKKRISKHDQRGTPSTLSWRQWTAQKAKAPVVGIVSGVRALGGRLIASPDVDSPPAYVRDTDLVRTERSTSADLQLDQSDNEVVTPEDHIERAESYILGGRSSLSGTITESYFGQTESRGSRIDIAQGDDAGDIVSPASSSSFSPAFPPSSENGYDAYDRLISASPPAGETAYGTDIELLEMFPSHAVKDGHGSDTDSSPSRQGVSPSPEARFGDKNRRPSDGVIPGTGRCTISPGPRDRMPRLVLLVENEIRDVSFAITRGSFIIGQWAGTDIGPPSHFDAFVKLEMGNDDGPVHCLLEFTRDDGGGTLYIDVEVDAQNELHFKQNWDGVPSQKIIEEHIDSGDVHVIALKISDEGTEDLANQDVPDWQHVEAELAQKREQFTQWRDLKVSEFSKFFTEEVDAEALAKQSMQTRLLLLHAVANIAAAHQSDALAAIVLEKGGNDELVEDLAQVLEEWAAKLIQAAVTTLGLPENEAKNAMIDWSVIVDPEGSNTIESMPSKESLLSADPRVGPPILPVDTSSSAREMTTFSSAPPESSEGTQSPSPARTDSSPERTRDGSPVPSGYPVSNRIIHMDPNKKENALAVSGGDRFGDDFDVLQNPISNRGFKDINMLKSAAKEPVHRHEAMESDDRPRPGEPGYQVEQKSMSAPAFDATASLARPLPLVELAPKSQSSASLGHDFMTGPPAVAESKDAIPRRFDSDDYDRDGQETLESDARERYEDMASRRLVALPNEPMILQVRRAIAEIKTNVGSEEKMHTLFRDLYTLLVIKEQQSEGRSRQALVKLTTLAGIPEVVMNVWELGLAAQLHSALDNQAVDTTDKQGVSRKVKIGLAAVGGGLLLALTGGLAAPAVAAGITAIGAGVAGLGLGAAGAAFAATLTALATFVATMGTAGAVVMFGVTGAGLTGWKMNTRWGSLKEFCFEKVDGSQPSSTQLAVCVPGTLDVDNPRSMVTQFSPICNPELTMYECNALVWESDVLKNVRRVLTRMLGQAAAQQAASMWLTWTLAATAATLMWPVYIISSMSDLDNAWTVSRERAMQAGEMLARALADKAVVGSRPVEEKFEK